MSIPQATIETSSLPVMEHFYTIQGEGKFTGSAAYFIRLGGCDVGCVWCDVKESWPMEAHPHFELAQIEGFVTSSKATIVVITGGEPAMHNLTELTEVIQSKGVRTHIETSGAHPLTGSWDWVCLSPKKFKNPLPEVYQEAHELKIIVYNKSDLQWALQEAAKVPESCECYLQPEWSKREVVQPLIVEFVKQNPRWKISIQTHKYLDIP